MAKVKHVGDKVVITMSFPKKHHEDLTQEESDEIFYNQIRLLFTENEEIEKNREKTVDEAKDLFIKALYKLWYLQTENKKL